MKSRTWCLLAYFVFVCSLGAGLSGCNQPDNPTPAKVTETPPAPTEKNLEVPKTTEGKAYGSSDMYKKRMRKPGT